MKGGMSFQGGNYTATVTIDANEALREVVKLDDALKKVSRTLENMSRGHDVSALWNEQAASIENVSRALEQFKTNTKSVENAENLMKAWNAFSAFHPDMKSVDILSQLDEGAKGLLSTAESLAKNLDSAFSIPSLTEAFDAFEKLEGAGANLNLIFAKLRQGDVSSLTDQIDTLSTRLDRAKTQASYLQSQLESYQSGTMFEQMQGEIDRLTAKLDSLDEVISRSKQEFSSYLSSAGFAGMDIDPESSYGQFAYYFEAISNGAMTVKEAIASVNRENPYIFQSATAENLASINAQLNSLSSSILSITEMIGRLGQETNFSSVQNGINETTNAAERGTAAMQEMADAETKIGTAAEGAGSFGDFLIAFTGASESLNQIVAQLQEISALVSEINSKDFSIKNVFQAGGDTQAVAQLRVYREEAMELAKYVNKLYTSFADVGHISADIFRVDKLRDAINDLSTMNIDTLFNKIGNTDNIGQIDAIRSQLMTYKEALEQIIAITQSHGIDIPMPDITKLEQATANVREFDEQAKQMSEAFAKEAADASAAAAGMQQVSAQTAELKLGVPEAATSFEQINIQLEAINGLLPQIGENIRTAFDFSTVASGLKSIQDGLSQMLTEQKVRITVDETSLPTLRDTITKSISDISNNIKLTIDNVEFTQAAQRKISKATSLLGVAGQFKFDEGSLSALSQTIQEAIQKVSSSIKLTIDNVELSASAQRKIAENASKAASGATDKQAHGTAKASVEEETAAIEKNIEAWYRDQEAWREAQEQKARAEGWKAADALKKEDARIEKEEESVRKAASAYYELEDAKRAAAAVASGGGGDVPPEPPDELRRLIDLYVQYYEAMKRVETARGSQNADSETRYTEIARGLEEVIDSILKVNPELEELATASDRVQRAMNGWADAADKTSSKMANDALRQQKRDAEEAAESLEKLKATISDISTGSGKIKFTANTDAMDEYNVALRNAKQAIADLEFADEASKTAAVQNAQAKVAALQAVVKKYNEEATAANNAQAMVNKMNNLANQIDIWKNANPTAYKNAQAQIDGYINTLRSGAPIAQATFANISAGFKDVAAQAKLAGTTGQTFFQQLQAGWQKFGGWSIVSRTFMSIIRIFKQSVTAVKEVDSAMTELRKVTDLTAEGYTKFYEQATQMAGEVGAKLSDVINSTAD